MKETQSSLTKWAGRLNATVRTRRSACQKLAAGKTAQAVPFLVSALTNSDEQTRCIAEEALRALEDPLAIDALALACACPKTDLLSEILTQLARPGANTVESPAPQSPSALPEPGPAEEVWRVRNSRDGTVLAFVPEGDFLAGKESSRVHLPAYYLALTCVTNAQYSQFLNDRRPKPTRLRDWIRLDPSHPIGNEGDTYTVDPERADYPVTWVKWAGAAAYCKWAGLRLPTELEWEKGARGIDGRQFPWGDEWEPGRPLFTGGDRQPETISSVNAYPTAKSPYGLYQMIGNIYEWCADWYQEDAYQRYAQGDLRPPAAGQNHALRGGPWRFATPVYLRTEYRRTNVWRLGTVRCGFRCAKSL